MGNVGWLHPPDHLGSVHSCVQRWRVQTASERAAKNPSVRSNRIGCCREKVNSNCIYALMQEILYTSKIPGLLVLFPSFPSFHPIATLDAVVIIHAPLLNPVKHLSWIKICGSKFHRVILHCVNKACHSIGTCSQSLATKPTYEFAPTPFF